MAVELKIDRKLDNNHVQVEATSKKTYTRYFKVPNEKADSFCASYKKHDKNMKYLSNASFVGSILLGCAIVSPFTKKISPGARMGIGIFAGIGAAIASVFATSKIMASKEKQLLRQHHSQEIFYQNKGLPI